MWTSKLEVPPGPLSGPLPGFMLTHRRVREPSPPLGRCSRLHEEPEKATSFSRIFPSLKAFLKNEPCMSHVLTLHQRERLGRNAHLPAARPTVNFPSNLSGGHGSFEETTAAAAPLPKRRAAGSALRLTSRAPPAGAAQRLAPSALSSPGPARLTLRALVELSLRRRLGDENRREAESPGGGRPSPQRRARPEHSHRPVLSTGMRRERTASGWGTEASAGDALFPLWPQFKSRRLFLFALFPASLRAPEALAAAVVLLGASHGTRRTKNNIQRYFGTNNVIYSKKDEQSVPTQEIYKETRAKTV
ncbi:hypothetical protein HPG69_017578 [Diceros bicornis minor]|uniref:Uncharacterized protein n=1 Tax=Diceros bicornis minor TaxID=77932 RepID=A0A7J7EL37_DICBM|nr:hypothetical protein HPG69_017578 [Diceros bicornis minor]